MKKIFLGFLLFFYTNTYSKSYDIYVDALFHFFENVIEVENYWQREEKRVYFKKITGITDAFPDSINGFQIIVIDDKQIEKIVEREDKFIVYHMFPLKFYNNKNFFGVSVLDAIIFKNGKKNLGMLVIHLFKYKYDCEKESLIYDDYEVGHYTGTIP